jgi:hypothetical protein
MKKNGNGSTTRPMRKSRQRHGLDRPMDMLAERGQEIDAETRQEL